MKKIINGKVYDTDKAQSLGVDGYSNPRDFNYWREELFRKRTGEYFLYGEGGPMTHYARTISDNEWSGGEKIIPLTAAKAREWAEHHLDAEEYANIFGLPDEDAEPAALNIQLPAELMGKLREAAELRGTTITACVAEILKNNL